MTIYGGKNFCSPKSALDALHDVLKMGLGDAIEGFPAFLLGGNKTAELHQSQVLGGNVALDRAGLGKFADRITVIEQHLDDLQPDRMRQCLKAAGRLPEGFHIQVMLRL